MGRGQFDAGVNGLMNIIPIQYFYKEPLHWWADFRAEFSTKPPISEYIILWNNKNI